MKSVLLRIEIGSTAYGTGDPGKEDYDEIAIAIEPKTCIYGLDKVDTYTYRPGRGPEDPSGPGDYDLVVYPLKKWFNLALNANPSVLMALWSKPGIYPSGLPTMTPLGEDLRANKGRFISNRIFDTHIGYAQGQIKRMKRGKFYKSRQKIVEEYGYDTKFAMHALRLVLQAQEIVETGSVEIPIPNPRGDLLRLVRKGGLSQDDFYALFDKSLDELKVLQKNSQLPDEPDRQWANEWLEKVYRDYYAER